MQTPRIELAGVRKSFGDNHVLRGVDLKVPKGRSMVVIGGSGTGKSITLKCVIGLVTADAGVVRLDGQDVTHARGAARDAVLDRFGMLFQGGALFDSLPVWRNVAFRLLQGKRRKSAEEARGIAIEKLRRVGLGPDTADRFPAELSGGMQKRVGLARAIAAEPEIIFFDEPTTGLDPVSAVRVDRMIREMSDRTGVTSIVVSHDLRSIFGIADRIVMLYQGKVRLDGPPSAFRASDDPVVHQFVNGLAEGPMEL